MIEATPRVLLQYEVEQFLYAEAALLDARRYRDWLALLARRHIFLDQTVILSTNMSTIF